MELIDGTAENATIPALIAHVYDRILGRISRERIDS